MMASGKHRFICFLYRQWSLSGLWRTVKCWQYWWLNAVPSHSMNLLLLLLSSAIKITFWSSVLIYWQVEVFRDALSCVWHVGSRAEWGESHHGPFLGHCELSVLVQCSTEIIMVIPANVIRHFHCSGPPDLIFNVEAMYTAPDHGKKQVGVAGNADVPGRDCFSCPSWKDNLSVNCPSLKSNNNSKDKWSEHDT